MQIHRFFHQVNVSLLWNRVHYAILACLQQIQTSRAEYNHYYRLGMYRRADAAYALPSSSRASHLYLRKCRYL